MGELEGLGLYDPGAPHADEKLALLEYLVRLGATDSDLVAYRHELPGLASVVVLRGGPPMTLVEAAARSGLARVVGVGAASDVVVPADLADLRPDGAVPIGPHHLKGFAEPVELYRIVC